MNSRSVPTSVGLALAAFAVAALSGGCFDRAPEGLRRTPGGPGATVRYDLAHRPLPDIPLPNDAATWPDPTSRTGLRINASLVAPTAIEQRARERFSQMEGWGTFSPISVAFDVDRTHPDYERYEGPALDLGNVRSRHQHDDYDFADDAVYLVNLDTGVPVVLDVGAGNFAYTLRQLDKYWANDTRVTERNLLWDTIDESQDGNVGPGAFTAEHDTDFDGVLDVPNLDDPRACPDPDPVCDDAANEAYGSAGCVETRRQRDRCLADHLLTWYERETDTLLLRPLLPLDEMTRYAVVVTDRLLDGRGNAVKSPFELVYHAAQEPAAARVQEILRAKAGTGASSYFGDLAGTGLDHVAFLWSFTTQPTVDDMKKLRDGLYGAGPFARFRDQFPPVLEVHRAVGKTADLDEGGMDPAGWEQDAAAGCPEKAGNLYLIRYASIREQMKTLLVNAFDIEEGPALDLLLRSFDSIDYMLVGSFQSPFLLEGGPASTDPNAAFRLDFQTGSGEQHEDTVQFWLIVPKETGEFSQPFDVNIYGHGYTGNFVELVLYAGNMARHGLATIGINAMGHGLSFGDAATEAAATGLLASSCVAPFADALSLSRARDLDQDGFADSGGDFWSSYLFHTRDGVRQSVLDHVQLVRILRGFGGDPTAKMICKNGTTGWGAPAEQPCDLNGDGAPEGAGDFDANGVPDIGGPGATYGTWGESLGGILSAIHGAIDPYVTAAVPGSGGGGLTDIGARSFQGGVVEAVLLRLWGPLLVSMPATDREPCKPEHDMNRRCTICATEEVSLRWVVPDVNGTGEVEIGCFKPQDLEGTTVFVQNLESGELRCARVDEERRFRIGLPSSAGDRVELSFYDGRDAVKSYATCEPSIPVGSEARLVVNTWRAGRFGEGTPNAIGTELCDGPTCSAFQGHFFAEGTPLFAPAEGFGQIRQTPALRRFLMLAQAALDPGDPINFAPYYAMKPMTGPFGAPIAPHAVLTLNTIGDMNVPLNAGIAFARATGALPFLRPDQAAKYPEYAGYATPDALFQALGGRTPNQELIDNHVIEGITTLARHPAGAECAQSANAKALDATYLSVEGGEMACYPACMEEGDGACHADTHCDVALGQCVPDPIGAARCEEALFDPDDLDEGAARIFEQSAAVPHRLARYTQPATAATLSEVWAPRLDGAPQGADFAWTPDPARPLTALLDAYVAPQGVHTFVNGEPCQGFDVGTYLTNLTARFFMSNGTDLYYLSHPATHHCLVDAETCDYLQAP